MVRYTQTIACRSWTRLTISQVLYKRKPVTMLPAPAKIDNNTEVWVMPKSGEVFADYESYLSRFEFYNRKKFTDAVNGKSNLTFFAAVDSE
ncbi:hypothetical protein KCV05_g17723, partial [Aureobasidium melanogenum]